ncbi:MFS transporter [Nonomuraea thailandensis]
MRSSPAAVRGTGTTGADRRHGVMLRLVGAGVMLTVMADTTATTLAVGVLRYTPSGAGMPLGDLVWLTSAAFIPIAALLATAGRWADLFGRRRVLAVGLVVFVLGGIATVTVEPWSYVLAARAVQGAGAAAMIPASLGLLLGELPESQRRGAIALWSSASGLGCLLMQAGGGWLAATVGWRALFVPDVIIGVALLVACVALPSGRRTPPRACRTCSAPGCWPPGSPSWSWPSPRPWPGAWTWCGWRWPRWPCSAARSRRPGTTACPRSTWPCGGGPGSSGAGWPPGGSARCRTGCSPCSRCTCCTSATPCSKSPCG